MYGKKIESEGPHDAFRERSASNPTGLWLRPASRLLFIGHLNQWNYVLCSVWCEWQDIVLPSIHTCPDDVWAYKLRSRWRCTCDHFALSAEIRKPWYEWIALVHKVRCQKLSSIVTISISTIWQEGDIISEVLKWNTATFVIIIALCIFDW